jgi:hypothetical protein
MTSMSNIFKKIAIYGCLAIGGYFLLPVYFDWRKEAAIAVNEPVPLHHEAHQGAVHFTPTFAGYYTLKLVLNAEQDLDTVSDTYDQFTKSIRAHMPELVDITIVDGLGEQVMSYLGSINQHNWTVSYSRTSIATGGVNVWFRGDRVYLESGKPYNLSYSLLGGRDIAQAINANITIERMSELHLLEGIFQAAWLLLMFVLFTISAVFRGAAWPST